MVFVPASIKVPDLRGKLVRLLFKVKKKRPIIDMHDNEAMVKRAIIRISAFYNPGACFEIEISTRTSTPFMNFMFTKFVTKVLGFRRRIASLLGYPGGESLMRFPSQTKSGTCPSSLIPFGGRKKKTEIWGEKEIIRLLPEELKKNPSLYIRESPFYKRPYLSGWIERKGDNIPPYKNLDLLNWGLARTKLKAF